MAKAMNGAFNLSERNRQMGYASIKYKSSDGLVVGAFTFKPASKERVMFPRHKPNPHRSVILARAAGCFKLRCVYALLCLIDHRAYIGITSDLKTRIGHHVHYLRNGRHDNGHLQESWNENGEGAFVFVILDTTPNASGIQEEAWMRLCKTRNRKFGFNLDSSGRTHSHSHETKEKMGNSSKGRKISLEARRKISAAKLGIKLPPRTQEQRENHRQAALGHAVSDETRKKISKAITGRTLSEEHKQKIRDFWRARRENNERRF